MTLRELEWAAQGRQYADWERTAELMALIANCHRDPKHKRTPWTRQDFFARPGERRIRRGRSLTVDDLRGLRGAIGKKR